MAGRPTLVAVLATGWGFVFGNSNGSQNPRPFDYAQGRSCPAQDADKDGAPARIIVFLIE